LDFSTDALVYETVLTGNNIGYSIDDVASGVYTLRVSKAGHVTRDYIVSVSTSSVVQNVELLQTGDITGDGNVDIRDLVRAKKHVAGIITLTSFAYTVADSDKNGIIDAADLALLRRHMLNL